MKIVKLSAENIKRLQAVEITPEGSVVKITGRNGEGKTSVLDSIWYALGGGDVLPSKPIREGTEKARVTLDLGDLIVERRFTAKGSQLFVKNAAGASYPSPQRMLDELVGRLTFDPLEFMRMQPKAQAVTLRDLAGLDFTALDQERAEAFEERTVVNREVKGLQAQVNAIRIPDDAPAEIEDPAELIEQIQQAQQQNTETEQLRAGLETVRDIKNKQEERIKLLRQEIMELEGVVEENAQRIARMEDDLAKAQIIDIAPLRERLGTIEERNTEARRRQERDRLAKQLADKEAESKKLTERLEAIDATKREQVAAAKLPVDGLGIDSAGEVTYQGIPVRQASSAEQLRVSVAMAMAMNPKLRVLRISDGSLLDSASMKIIEQMASDGDYQVWIELVDESGKVGIVIEDGRVKAASGEQEQFALSE